MLSPDEKRRRHNAYIRDWNARNPGYYQTPERKEKARLAAERNRLKRGKAALKQDRQMQRLDNPVLYLLRKTRARAKHKGYEYDLTEQWARDRFTGRCEATGLTFSMETGTAAKNNPWAPTLDRRDPSKGYTQDNCWIVCWAYNCAKQAWTEETVMAMAMALTRKSKT